MWRKVGLTIGFLFVAAYIVGLVFVFRRNTIKAIKIDSIDTPGQIAEAYGNGGLQSLLIFENGSAEFIDAASPIVATNFTPSVSGTHIKTGMLSPAGNIYMMDDRKVLYRWYQKAAMERSKPLKVAGDVLEIAVEESRRILWCAMAGHDPAPDALMIYAISLQNGKVLGSVNLETHLGKMQFAVSKTGDGVVLAISDTPGAFFFICKDETIDSRFLDTGDLVQSAVFDQTDILMGLRSGLVVRIDTQSGHLSQTYRTDFLPVNQIALSNHMIGIAHGDGNSILGVGSSYIVDRVTGGILARCGNKDQVTSVSVHGDANPFVFGQLSGAIQVSTEENSCQALELPVADQPGAIRLLETRWPICLVVGSSKIQRIEFAR